MGNERETLGFVHNDVCRRVVIYSLPGWNLRSSPGEARGKNRKIDRGQKHQNGKRWARERERQRERDREREREDRERERRERERRGTLDGMHLWCLRGLEAEQSFLFFHVLERVLADIQDISIPD